MRATDIIPVGVVGARSVPGRGFDGGGFVMRWKPVVVQSERSDGSLLVVHEVPAG